MTALKTVLLLGSALALGACQRAESPEAAPEPAATPSTSADPAATEPPPAEQIQLATTARSTLQAVGDSGIGGELRFTVENGAVHVTGTLTGLKPGGTHALHIHEFGNCTAADASSAGGHFNPAAAAHGDREGGGEHHAGDIPNQTADRDGNASVDQRLEGLEIGSDGELDILGRGVIVHADPDDYTTQPTGNAGGRLACGVIEGEIGGATETGPAQ